MFLVDVENNLVNEAVTIVEKLLHEKDFFFKTYGTVLNKIGQHYKMPELSNDDLDELRDKLAPIRLSGAVPLCSESLYMFCYTNNHQIYIDEKVCSFHPAPLFLVISVFASD
jgi:hypothetical protein